MKKNNTKSIVLLITLMLMVCLMGCSNAATQSEETAQPETQVTVEEETTEVEESEVVPEEEVAEEPEEVVTEEPTQPEEVEEPRVVEDPGEVTYITDFANLHLYVETLDAYEPDILVYNEEEGYIINMQEGQHYQLKANDQIAFYNPEGAIKVGWNFDLGGDTLVIENCEFIQVDYSKMEQNNEFYFIKLNENEEKIRRTCYFDPPTE